MMKSIGAKKVIEVGSFTGYFSLTAALACGKDSKIYALDTNELFTSCGIPFWKQAGVNKNIELCLAPAVETL